jgi:hypothetical protein
MPMDWLGVTPPVPTPPAPPMALAETDTGSPPAAVPQLLAVALPPLPPGPPTLEPPLEPPIALLEAETLPPFDVAVVVARAAPPLQLPTV